jgi:phosphatidylserine/phosphatidylglycerophosphate/cardiolipin synthase-like enzyme
MDRVIVAPEGRRSAVIEVIDSATTRLILSLYRCDDRRVLEALGSAARRGVRVEVLLTRRAGDRSPLRLLRLLLETLGITVHRYADRRVKYHAKYVVADDRKALVGSLNFTRRCFAKTSDFLVVTEDAGVIASLAALFDADCRTPAGPLPRRLSARLIVAPHLARTDVHRLLRGAERSIRLVDPKLSDPAMLSMLRARAAAGVSVKVLDGRRIAGMRSHGKLLILDDAVAVVGSLALSTETLDTRREIALLVQDEIPVRRLVQFFDQAAGQERASRPVRPLESVA